MAQRDDGITLLSTLVNFGALTAFLALHVSVIAHYIIRRGSRDYVRHLLVPLCGLVVLTFVVIKANVAAQRVGLIWLSVGVVVAAFLWLTGRRPELAGLDARET
jgi:amino acid transporter